MLNLFFEESNDDFFSMIFLNFWLFLVVIDFLEEVKFEDENDVLSLENVNIDNVDWMIIVVVKSC